MAKKCYMCNRESTSKEHVPPKCIFPEIKDVGEDFRKSLITVPSCDLHNSCKSADDEFLLTSIGGVVGCNKTGLIHKFTKVNRSIHNSSFKIFEKAFSDRKVQVITGEDGQCIDVVWGKPDIERLTTCFDHISRGLFYFDNNASFEGDIKVVIGFLRKGSLNYESFVGIIKEKLKSELREDNWKGANPEIFRYQFTQPDSHGIFMVAMKFYGNLDVYASFLPSGFKPPENFVGVLLDQGVPMTVKEGDKLFRFNDAPG